MWLLNVERSLSAEGRLELEYFQETPPPYVILSHRWGKDEVQFADLKGSSVSSKHGYKKIRWTLEQARSDGCNYAWVDTCCIDKSSSAELSEAINTMYAWYRDAKACYAYLEDVSADGTVDWHKRFHASQWFMRGWTLQELLAPKVMHFVDSGWRSLGTRQELHTAIEDATGISAEYLTGVRSVFAASVARRMSWASRRVTTRKEDIAYCLMGLFDINMPMLYGEGSKAFLRLQEEILRSSDDQTLFAWQLDNDTTSASSPLRCGLFADSPAAFKCSESMIPFETMTLVAHLASQVQEPFTVTNKDVHIQLNVEDRTHENGGLVAMLDCTRHDEAGFVGLALMSTGESPNHFARTNAKICKLSEIPRQKRWIYIRPKPERQQAKIPYHHIRFLGCSGNLEVAARGHFVLTSRRPSGPEGVACFFYNAATSTRGDRATSDVVRLPKGQRLAAVVVFEPLRFENRFVLMVGSSDVHWGLMAAVWRPQHGMRLDLHLYQHVREMVQSSPRYNSVAQELYRVFHPQPPGTLLELGRGLNVVVDVSRDHGVDNITVILQDTHIEAHERTREHGRTKERGPLTQMRSRVQGALSFGRSERSEDRAWVWDRQQHRQSNADFPTSTRS